VVSIGDTQVEVTTLHLIPFRIAGHTTYPQRYLRPRRR